MRRPYSFIPTGFVLFLTSIVFLSGEVRAQTITAERVGKGNIRVRVPGIYETTFPMRKGFVGRFWDLKNDPEKKLDLAPVLDENGILWVKLAEEGAPGASWYANPPMKIELLEDRDQLLSACHG